MAYVSSKLPWSAGWGASSTSRWVWLSKPVGASGRAEAREKRATASRDTPMRTFMRTSGGWLKEFTFKRDGCQVKKRLKANRLRGDCYLTNWGDSPLDQGT